LEVISLFVAELHIHTIPYFINILNREKYPKKSITINA
jgi:hypothetical protein